MTEIRLRFVEKTPRDSLFLYKLLEERPNYANISHNKLPSYCEHFNFIISDPYRYWFIILDGVLKVGSLNVTKKNELGIFIKKKFKRQNYAFKALKYFLEKYPNDYLANISPHNQPSMNLFKKLNFKLVQHTFTNGLKNE